MNATKASCLLAFLLLCASLTSCQLLGITTADLGALSESDSREFLVASTMGVVQARESFEDPWRFVKVGDTLTTEHYIRTGINSSADLILVNGGDDMNVKLHSLMPEMELYDAYQKLLCPDGYAKYLREKADDGDCVGKNPVMICRSTMHPAKENDFLAVANVTLELKNQPAAVGGAAASAGGGGGGGGC